MYHVLHLRLHVYLHYTSGGVRRHQRRVLHGLDLLPIMRMPTCHRTATRAGALARTQASTSMFADDMFRGLRRSSLCTESRSFQWYCHPHWVDLPGGSVEIVDVVDVALFLYIYVDFPRLWTSHGRATRCVSITLDGYQYITTAGINYNFCAKTWLDELFTRSMLCSS